ncbi:Transmembrane_domain-containing protein [Hexamita inflata]|uniref:Transmembrane domain-containing protein n=1 Tax=Hexamita inflata TaxID=28002 RepID=A0AA86NPU7_9EUKA|nr:Transmembrane domain-containing protein [Hexamita inflata]
MAKEDFAAFPIIALIMRICGGTGGFSFAKAWGFYADSEYAAGKFKGFSHPYMQVVMIFLGEALVGLVGLFDKKTKHDKFHVKHILRCIVPAALDAAAQTFSNLGIGGELISVQQIFRLTTILFATPLCAIFSDFRDSFAINMKAKIQSLIIMTCAFVVVGVASISFTPVVQPDCGSTAKSMSYVIFSGFLSGLYTISTRMYKSANMHPLTQQSMEGVVGMILYMLVLPILNHFQLEFPGEWFYRHTHTWYITLNQILFLTAVFTVTLGGYYCSKFTSNLSFQVIEAARPLLVTVVTMIVKFEKPEVKFTLVSLSAQCIIIYATIIHFTEPTTKAKQISEQADALVVGSADTLEINTKTKRKTTKRENSDILE